VRAIGRLAHVIRGRLPQAFLGQLAALAIVVLQVACPLAWGCCVASSGKCKRKQFDKK
jgi:hypothetical protein